MTNRPFGKIAFFSLLTGLCGLMLSLTGCGGGGNNGATTGPSGSSGFAGASISINPTMQFFTGGTVNYFNVESGSAFPASATATAGTYTYVPNSNYTAGVLSVVLGAPLNTTLTFNLSDYTASNGNVRSFKATYNGATYTGSVSSGTIVAYIAPSTGGSGGGTVVVPSGGISASLKATETNRSGPYNNGDLVNFGISKTTLNFSGKSLTSPTVAAIDLSRSNYTFLDASSGLSYQVEFNGETFNGLISVFNSSTFVGAFIR